VLVANQQEPFCLSAIASIVRLMVIVANSTAVYYETGIAILSNHRLIWANSLLNPVFLPKLSLCRERVEETFVLSQALSKITVIQHEGIAIRAKAKRHFDQFSDDH